MQSKNARVKRMAKPLAAYVRVSTEQQREDGSHIGQRETIADWADDEGYDIGAWDSYHEKGEDGDIVEWSSIDGESTGEVQWYEDIAISGQAEDREGYERLMDRYKSHDVVVFRELSRFGRDPVRVTKDATEIMESDIGFVSVTEPEWDSTSATGKFMMRQFANMNAFYADLRREQAVKGAERRKEQGLPVGRPKKLDPDQIDEVRELHDAGVSYTSIARVMESKPNGPKSISRETIRRYCKEAEA